MRVGYNNKNHTELKSQISKELLENQEQRGYLIEELYSMREYVSRLEKAIDFKSSKIRELKKHLAQLNYNQESI